MLSIRCVTVKPPKTLMLATRVAMRAKMTTVELSDPTWSSAPTTMIPLMALVTDINGVCSAWWTLPMT